MGEYKQRQQEWVSGHGGTSPFEVQAVFMSSVASALVFRSVQDRLPNDKAWVTRGLLEYCIFVLPILACITQPQEATWICFALALLAFVSLLMRVPVLNQRAVETSLNERSKPFLNMFRANMVLSTIITILAVDFSVFPRRFAKTETAGYSVMDIGVGGFIGSNALVSGGPRARSVSLSRTMMSTVPIFVLGGARLASVSAIDYQHHDSEYGVHWNFFLTLGCIQVIFALYKKVFGESHAIIVGLVLSAGHEACLRMGLAEYVEHAPRLTLVSANKEGLVSIGGYASLFLVMVGLSSLLLQKKSRTYAEWKHLCIRIWAITGICTTVTLAHYQAGGVPSRKLMNASYIIWAVTVCLFMTSVYMTVDLVSPPARSVLFDAINRNQLAFFLASNLLTGAVNMGMNTLDASWGVSQAVLITYSLVATTAVLVAHKRNFTIKFW